MLIYQFVNAALTDAMLDTPSRDAVPSRRRAAGGARVSAAASAYEALRDAIVAMRMLPGSPIQERDLTARFGVSRTPVREALLRLADEGLVEIRPQSGTFVARIPLAAIPEAVLVRRALEGACIEIAAARAGPADLDALAGIVAAQRRAAARGATADFHAADEAFHERIAGVAGHPGIWRLMRPAKAQLDRCRLLTLPIAGRMERVVDEHARVLAGLRAGDPAAALRAMHDHLAAVMPDPAPLRDRHPDYFV